MELHDDNNKMNHHITESPKQLSNYQILTANLVPWCCSTGQTLVVQIISRFFWGHKQCGIVLTLFNFATDVQ
jgi:hypothetical protein